MLKDMLLTKALMGSSGGGGGTSGDGVLIIHTDEENTLDKTWQEIHDSDVPAFITHSYDDGDEGAGVGWEFVADVSLFNGVYYVMSNGMGGTNSFETNSADGYPAMRINN